MMHFFVFFFAQKWNVACWTLRKMAIYTSKIHIDSRLHSALCELIIIIIVILEISFYISLKLMHLVCYKYKSRECQLAANRINDQMTKNRLYYTVI